MWGTDVMNGGTGSREVGMEHITVFRVEDMKGREITGVTGEKGAFFM